MTENINRKPRNFNWVAVRTKCSIRQMFEELRLGVTQDVEAIRAEGSPIGQAPRRFKIVEDSKTIKVFEDDPYRDHCPSVLFVLTGDAIKVKDGETNQIMFDISIVLNNEGECRFIVEKEELDSWQIRRKALEGMFFRA